MFCLLNYPWKIFAEVNMRARQPYTYITGFWLVTSLRYTSETWIFVCSWCCTLTITSINFQEIKQGYLAQKHALLVAKNLRLLMKGSPNSKLATYSTGYPLALVSLGRNEGLAQLPFLTISGCLPGIIKSQDLFVSKTRKQMGLNAWTAVQGKHETCFVLVFKWINFLCTFLMYL